MKENEKEHRYCLVCQERLAYASVQKSLPPVLLSKCFSFQLLLRQYISLTACITSRIIMHLTALRREGWDNAFRVHHALKVDMDHMKLQLREFERMFCHCNKLGEKWLAVEVTRAFGIHSYI
ncbi:hypothetical protein KP509_28G016800 [Ceratopteris richardii]|uniref:Uncharacterized protein n=1 Tax=Ceratopteris richardii TaxID=49495 RepID=A0A8T2RA16_CERRI|nr:hypothetical protein KP509_28G016800 [Ceratopteris richardii]